jgi:hypothetical protein
MAAIVTMERSHLIRVANAMREVDRYEIGCVWREPDTVSWAERHSARPGLHFALLSKGDPVACGGIIDAMPGVGTAWMIARISWTPFVKTIARAFRVVAADGIYRRIQAYINPGNEPAKIFAMWLGFEYEGECKCLAPNGDSMLQFAYTRR